MKVKSEIEVAQSCPTLNDPMDCDPPGPPSMGFSRQEKWGAIAFSTDSILKSRDIALTTKVCLVKVWFSQ